MCTDGKRCPSSHLTGERLEQHNARRRAAYGAKKSVTAWAGDQGKADAVKDLSPVEAAQWAADEGAPATLTLDKEPAPEVLETQRSAAMQDLHLHSELAAKDLTSMADDELASHKTEATDLYIREEARRLAAPWDQMQVGAVAEAIQEMERALSEERDRDVKKLNDIVRNTKDEDLPQAVVEMEAFTAKAYARWETIPNTGGWGADYQHMRRNQLAFIERMEPGEEQTMARLRYLGSADMSEYQAVPDDEFKACHTTALGMYENAVRAQAQDPSEAHERAVTDAQTALRGFDIDSMRRMSAVVNSKDARHIDYLVNETRKDIANMMVEQMKEIEARHENIGTADAVAKAMVSVHESKSKTERVVEDAERDSRKDTGGLNRITHSRNLAAAYGDFKQAKELGADPARTDALIAQTQEVYARFDEVQQVEDRAALEALKSPDSTYMDRRKAAGLKHRALERQSMGMKDADAYLKEVEEAVASLPEEK